MIDVKKYGLTINLLSAKIMPSLTPALANPTLNLDEVTSFLDSLWFICHYIITPHYWFQFNDLVDLLSEMLTYIAKSQRNKLLLEKNTPITISQEMLVVLICFAFFLN